MPGTLPDCLLSACCSRWPQQMSVACCPGLAGGQCDAGKQCSACTHHVAQRSASGLRRQHVLQKLNQVVKPCARRTGVCSKVSAAAAWIRRRWPWPPSTKRRACALQMKMKLHKCEHHVAARTKHPNSLYGSRQVPCKYEGKRWQATCINRFPHHITAPRCHCP